MKLWSCRGSAPMGAVGLAVFASCLNGCLLLSPEAAPGYNGKGFRDPEYTDYASIDSAISWANDVRSQLRELKIEADVDRRLVNYGVVGVGLAAVGAAAFNASKNAIVGLALGTAGLNTIDYITDVPFQEQTIGDGLNAIDCIQSSAISIDTNLGDNLPKQQMAQTNGPNGPEMTLQQAARHLQSLTRPALVTNGVNPSPSDARIIATLASKTVDAANQQAAAAGQAQQAAAQVKLAAPAYLIDGTLKIRRAVLSAIDSHLPKTSDISSFIELQKQKLKNASGSSKDAKDTANQTSTTASDTQSASASATAAATPEISNAASSVQGTASQAASTAQKQIDLYQTLSDEVQACKQITDTLGSGGGR